jgi:hypothetical protein
MTHHRAATVFAGVLALALWMPQSADAQGRQRARSSPRPSSGRQAVPRQSAPPPAARGVDRSEGAPRGGTREPAGQRPGSTGPTTGQAVPRSSEPPPDRGAGDRGAGIRSGGGGGDESRRPVSQAVPRFSRPRGDNPIVGQAVARGTVPTTTVNRVIVSSFGSAYYPFGFGPFGSRFFYYDPYWYYDPFWLGYSPYYAPYSYAYGPAPPPASYYSGYGFNTGAIRLKVSPREAQVWVDGYYVGVVDDFDGVFQRLRLDEGPHRIEFRAPGYETLVVDVRILAGDTITYRGDLRVTP